MTIIAVRFGILAVDSLVSSNTFIVGETQKFRFPRHEFGGGVVAACGELGKADLLLNKYPSDGEFSIDGVSAVHLMSNGRVRVTDGGAWYIFDAPFYSAGLNEGFALAAMHAGATAKEAVEIVCRMCPSSCGGKIFEIDASGAML